MINFKKISFENFLSSGNIPTEIILNSADTSIITGTNGAGKTTFLDALLYGLFNKPLRNIKLNQLVNSINKKKMLVKLEFDINGRQYEIHRGQKPAIFSIFVDGVRQNEDASARDLQTKLENEIIRTNYKTFNQVVILASMKFANFMDLNPGERRTVVEQMLDIEIIGNMSNLLKDRIKQNKINLDSNTNDHTNISKEITHISQIIENTRNMKNQEISRIESNIESTNQRILSIRNELKQKQNELTDLVENKKPIFDKEQEYKRHTLAKEKLEKLKTELESYHDKVTNMKVEVSTVKNNSMVSSKNVSELESISNFYRANNNCKVCHQDIEHDFKQNIINENSIKIKELQKTIDNNTAIIRTRNTEYNVIQETRNELKSLISEQEQIINSVSAAVDKVKSWKQAYDMKLKDISSLNERIETQRELKNKLIQSKNDVMEQGTVDLGDKFDDIHKLEIELSSIAERRAEIAEESELCSLATNVLKDNGLKAKIIKQYLPIINDSINYYLDKLGAHYSFVLDEEFNETIKSRYRDLFTYGSFSNGESMRINLAILFMWRKLAESKNTVHTNLLIMDEILDGSLDKEGIDAVLEMFEETKSNVFVISHRKEIIPKFDKHIHVSKIGNFPKYDGLDEKM